MSDKIDFKAVEDGRADELMRETMAGHRMEPKPSLWKGISRKLLWRELIHFNFTNFSPKFWAAGTAGLMLLATALYFGLPGAVPDKVSLTPKGSMNMVAFSGRNPVANSSTGSRSNADQNNMENTVDELRPNQAQSVVKSTLPGYKAGQKAVASGPAVQKKSNNALLAESVLMSGDLAESNLSSSYEVVSSTTQGITRVLPYDASLLPASPGTDTIITLSNIGGIIKFRKTSPVAVQFFSANLGITPELAFYTAPEVYSEANFWLNGGITYHISRFSVATGFGLGYVYDEGKYLVEYKSRDSIGFFTSVTSYTVGPSSEIMYNTQTISVYDSLQHLADFRTRNRYSYLQLPLLLGYSLIESSRVSLAFQVGPAISLLLGSRNSDPVIEYTNARIIRVDNDTPARVKPNWQIWANLYFEMRMNKKVSIYLEPSFKYYLKPMVTQENVAYKAPWTIGLGIGLQFNFGQKKTSP